MYGVTCVVLLLAAPAGATTIVMPTDDQLLEKSPVVVRGLILRSTPVARGNAIWTETLLQVDEQIKGSAPRTIVIREMGGVVDDRITKIHGAPVYASGERVLAFLAPTPRGDYQTVDLFAGKFSTDYASDGRVLWTRADADPHVDVLNADLEPLPASPLQRDASRFETYLRARVAGRPATRDYAIAAVRHNTLRMAPNFSLIDEPTVYRWFAFDTGTKVSWRSSGTQPGYSGGGISEVREGLSSWTGYSGAKILFTYDGTFSTAPGGLDASNGINEVLLSDPLSEIAGSFNPSTGGVVGRGGFNGVSSSRTWTSPFNADATHQGTFRAWNIVEGNLVIQDGVTPAAGMSSSRLAEIIAHEFGHTLGFGHSADRAALMYSSVTGIGPSLRDDDRLAARWLYPSSSSAPEPPPPVVTIPASPSNLTGTASGNSVRLEWSDNASNESGQRVYYAAAGGSFLVAGDVAAGQRSASVNGLSDGAWRFYITAYNSAGESTASNTASATVATAPVVPLVASFTFSPTNPIAEDPVSFTDTSTGGVTSRLWSFGDGSTSGQATPVKRYGSSGTYSVTLTVYRGSESKVISRAITIAAQTPVQPPVEAYRSVVPVSAQSEGVGGSIWRTELTLFNAGSEGVHANLIFVPGAGGQVRTGTQFLSPRQSVTYPNVLRDVFGMTAGSGAIAIEAVGAAATPDLKITSRTFNDAASGTYGLAVPDVFASELQQTLYLTGLASTTDFRTNLGLVNRGEAPVAAALTLYGAGGNVLASSSLSIPAGSFQQEALQTYFPSISGRSLPAMSMRVVANAANSLSVYASVVDNRTHDPIYLSAVPAPSRRETVVPVVGRTPGANGTFWRSDVTLFNPGTGWLPVALRYGGKSKSLFLAANETLVIADIVDAMGFQSGTGTLIAAWDASTGPVITTRNYTSAASGGTFGQSIDPVAEFSAETYVAGLRSDPSFRSNVGFVNGGSQPITVVVTLYASSGAEVATASLSLNPEQLVQTSVAAMFPGVNSSTLGHFTLRAQATAAGLFAYGTVIDNASGDPVFVAGR